VATVVNKRFESFDVYIGRGSPWGNEFSHRKGTKARYLVDTREEAVAAYRRQLWARLESEPELIHKVAALHDKTLGCFCKPLACHGDVLVAAAEWAVGEIERRRAS